MSIKVELSELGARLDDHDLAYLVTVADDGRARILAVAPRSGAGGLVIPDAGRSAPANATARPDVTLVFPPRAADGFTLLVDGVASVDGETITVAPTAAVLHRPAATRPA
jgi:hypothetical protein